MRSLLLFFLGVPIPIIILIACFSTDARVATGLLNVRHESSQNINARKGIYVFSFGVIPARAD